MTETMVVTGASGFIGSKIAARALAAGYRVVNVDRRPSSNPDLDTRLCDISDAAALAEAFPGEAAAVVHMAARTSVLESKTDPQGVFETNMIGTQNLLELSRRRGVRSFVLASTNAVVGETKDPYITESSALAPLTPYGATKAAGEMLLSAYAGSYGIACASIRLTNVYGTGMQQKDSIVPRIMRALLGGKPLEIYGDGLQWRDFVYAADVVDAFFMALDQGLVGPLVVGAGQSFSVRDVISAAEQAIGREVPVVWGPARSGEMRGVRVDIAKARSLGFEPRVGLVEGLALVWEDFSRV
ncbi:MAG: NAD-dependent epimerase/dehydratase family protein [Actinomycetota bacterium]|nr:NAD-dependent epimerase/dehydratase family protein [Actinomycetota bacterium]